VGDRGWWFAREDRKALMFYYTERLKFKAWLLRAFFTTYRTEEGASQRREGRPTLLLPFMINNYFTIGNVI